MKLLLFVIICPWVLTAATPSTPVLPALFEPAGRNTVAIVKGQRYLLTPQEAAIPGLRMQIVGANSAASVQYLEPRSSFSSYFMGSDEKQWQTRVPHYAKAVFRAVYPGVDLLYHASAGQLEYDFLVHPGADPRKIALRFPDARDLHIDAKGDLLVATAQGTVRQAKPVLYQQCEGRRTPVEGAFHLENGEVRFDIGSYDPERTLVIDPTWFTELSGSGQDSGLAITFDPIGNIIIAGSSYGFTVAPTTVIPGNILFGANAFVAKLSGSTGNLLYLAHFGGMGDDVARSVKIDSAGNIVVAGSTSSTNFPVKSAFQASYGGGAVDGFITKINAAGNALMFSTYIGGSGSDEVNGVALDSSDRVYVTGYTESSNFYPPNDWISGLNGTRDAFVTQLYASGALRHSILLGGSRTDTGRGIAVRGDGIYVTGDTTSTDFPLSNPMQATYGGSTDAFVTKFILFGPTEYLGLRYSTYVGGAGRDEASSIAVDSDGRAWIAGGTTSTPSGAMCAYVRRMSDIGSSSDHYNTYCASPRGSYYNAIAVGPNNIAYAAGYLVYEYQTPANAERIVGRYGDSGLIADSVTMTIGWLNHDINYGIAVAPGELWTMKIYTVGSRSPLSSTNFDVFVSASDWF